MNNFEKILDLLQVKNRSQKEEEELNSLLKNEEENRSFYENYILIEKIIKNHKHISHDELADYILIKNGLQPENKNIVNHIPKIEKHLRECSFCENEFKTLNSEFSDIENYISEKSINKEYGKTEAKKKNNISSYIFPSVIALVLIYVVLIFVSDVSAPHYYDYASLENSDNFYVTRGRASENFQNGINELEKNNYESAIGYFKKDIEENHNEETIFYSYYILGLTYLETAEESFIGLFPSFNQNKVENALNNFLMSIEENNSGKFKNISLDAYYYTAKAYLMQDNPEMAKKYLTMVIDEKGSKMNEAVNILNELE